ncbi:hypothetical protein FB45DRAFT_1021809 [Roridomyces roridus]|uniref:Uncharacterized protein n=1 Tax=Roridomyces roridus TaxID=1738132 RepID=A0AAD7FVU7_9AGAR|nr:hypothetical protein FB45DRAFT_1021809 [Roridomyces roridus]
MPPNFPHALTLAMCCPLDPSTRLISLHTDQSSHGQSHCPATPDDSLPAGLPVQLVDAKHGLMTDEELNGAQ